ncbi:MAG: porin family protein [Bacteroidetes bacterium]|nr:porin family protein [Bacteroidota bacterium]
MNKIFSKAAFIIVLLSILTFTSNVDAQVYIRSIGISGGMYSPSMDYWSENALSSWSDEFGSSPFGNVNIELNVVTYMNVRLGVGYWSQALTQGNITFGNELRSDEITLQMLPVNFDILARTDEDFSPKFGLYGGIGAAVNFVTLKYSTSIPSLGTFEEEHSGRDLFGHLILGADYLIMDTFAIGAEVRYVFGRYQQQEYDSNGNIFGNNVSIDGAQFMATFKYVFCGCED